MKRLFYLLGLVSIGLLTVTTSCEDDTVEPGEVRSRFTPVQDTNDPFTWTFTNESLNAVSYSWNFGDGGTSTEESPSHTYAAEDDYTVSMTATGSDGSTHTSTKDITVADPTTELKKLTGETSKTWKLIRDVSGGQYPLEVGPADRSQIWFALGLNASIATRPCLMEEEYIFSFNGDYEYKPLDNMVWAEEGVWDAGVQATCVDATVGSNMLNSDGADISAWGPGMFTFDYDVAAAELTLNGLGAHVGSAKVGTDGEFTTPQLAVTYKVISIDTDGPVDILVLETELPQPGYWKFTLVSYDDPNDEPELPNLPEAVFSVATDGLTATFTNGSINSDTYSWDFGDGNMSSETNPVHTYAMDGVYDVMLTATGTNGSDDVTQAVIACESDDFVAANLHGGSSKVWKLYQQGGGALKVGQWPNVGNYFETSFEDVTTRSCTFDDTYTFYSDGTFEYRTNGDLWGEAYMGLTDGACAMTSDLMGDQAAWGDGDHTFTTVDGMDGAGRITVTGTGAFIALPKAYNGGEYQPGESPAVGGSVTYDVLCYFDNGTDEIIVIAVDITGTGDVWWTFTLQAE